MSVPESNWLANATLHLLRRGIPLLPGGRTAAKPTNILVVRLGNLGDIVVALPAFHAIRRRFPDARITLLTSPTKRGAPGAEQVLKRDTDTFDAIIPYYADESGRPDFWRKLSARVRRDAIDTVIFLPDDKCRLRNIAKHLALLTASGVRVYHGCRLRTAREHVCHQTDRLMGLLAPLEIEGVEPPPWIRFGAEDEAAAARLIDGLPHPLVALQCGAKRPANRWSPASFAEVGRRLADEHGAGIVLTGSPAERDFITGIAAAIGPAARNLAGSCEIPELAAVLRQCALLVSNDTGTTHVAAAMGTPVISIFSARDHAHRWHPYGYDHLVLRKDPDCALCQLDECPLADPAPCLAAITPDEVCAAAAPFLAPK